jgi:hypothetical protein
MRLVRDRPLQSGRHMKPRSFGEAPGAIVTQHSPAFRDLLGDTNPQGYPEHRDRHRVSAQATAESFEKAAGLYRVAATKLDEASHQPVTPPKGSGPPSILAHVGHVLSENQNGLIMRVQVTGASVIAEREAALSMLEQYEKQTNHRAKTIGTDKGYDSGEFLQTLESRHVEPHIAIRDVKRNHEARPPSQQAAHDTRVRMQARRDETDYQLSQRCRKTVEVCFC